MLSFIPERLDAVQSIKKTLGSDEFFIEVKGFLPIAIDVLTGLVVMLTSRLVISTVACILILRMVE